MMKTRTTWLALVFVLLPGLAFCGGTVETPEAEDSWWRLLDIPRTPTEPELPVGLTLDVADREAVTGVERLVSYNSGLNAIQRLYTILENDNARVYWEFHLGGALRVPFSGSPGGYEVLAARLNLLNPKRPFARRVLSQIRSLREYLAATGLGLSTQGIQLVDSIQADNLRYLAPRVFTRVGIGIALPFTMPLDAVFSGYGGQKVFEPDHTFAFVAYDILDLLSVQVGFDIGTFDALYVGASIDASTPVYSFTSQFIYMLRNAFF